jgi:5-methylcytosine-specific restriction endonuclease McrA
MFSRIFDSLWDSSLMTEEVDVRWLFLTMLRLGRQQGDGMVDMPIASLARHAVMPPDRVEVALGRLMAPDPDSRSPEEEGRRIVAIDPDRPTRGWRIVNFAYYKELHRREDQRESTRLRVQRHRSHVTPVTDGNAPVTGSNKVTQNVTKKRLFISHSLSPSPEESPRCVYCGLTAEQVGAPLATDHFRPRSRGGGREPENLILACVSCNSSKGSYEFDSIEEARSWLHQRLWRSRRRSWIARRRLAFGGVPPAGLSKDPKVVSDEGFEEFWSLYPKKDGRKAAERAWRGLSNAKRRLAAQAVSRYVQVVAGRDRKFIKNPATWLNGEHFNDETIAVAPQPSVSPATHSKRDPSSPEAPPWVKTLDRWVQDRDPRLTDELFELLERWRAGEEIAEAEPKIP